MIDSLLLKIPRKSKPGDESHYNYKKALTDIDFTNKGSKKLIVIFPQWKSDGKLTARYKKRLLSQNYDVIIVHMNTQVLEADIQRVIESYNYIRDSISDALQVIMEKHHYSKIDFIALSLGCVSANLVASKFKDLDEITYVVSGASLANGVWDSALTKTMRLEFESKKVTLEELRIAWKEISPESNVSTFKNKEVFFIKSSKDIYVPSVLQQNLIDSLTNAGAKVSVKNVKTGHAATISRYYLIGIQQ